MSALASRESLPDTAKDHAKKNFLKAKPSLVVPLQILRPPPCTSSISLPWEFSSQQRQG